jgi:hypothetical protein
MSVPTPGEHPTPAPPAGEEIHLPGPTLLPLVTAIAITLIVIGTTISVFISIIGLVILVVATIRWIKDTRRDLAALPDEHR